MSMRAYDREVGAGMLSSFGPLKGGRADPMFLGVGFIRDYDAYNDSQTLAVGRMSGDSASSLECRLPTQPLCGVRHLNEEMVELDGWWWVNLYFVFCQKLTHASKWL